MKYIFLHIPKTAGTGLRQAMMGAYAPQKVAGCYRMGYLREDLGIAVNEGKELIAGHFDFSQLEGIWDPQQYQLICMLRHPVERTISTFLHFQKTGNQAFSAIGVEKMSFAEYLESAYANNWMSQILAGKKSWIPEPKQGGQLHQLARANFQKLGWVGVTEKFDDALFSLSVFMGKNLRHPGTRNLGGLDQQHAKLRSTYGQELTARNESDLWLYRHAESSMYRHLQSLNFRKIRRRFHNWNSKRQL